MKLDPSSLRDLGKREAFLQGEAIQLGRSREAGRLRREEFLAMTAARLRVLPTRPDWGDRQAALVLRPATRRDDLSNSMTAFGSRLMIIK